MRAAAARFLAAFAYLGVGHGVIVQVKAHIGRLAHMGHQAFFDNKWIGGQGQQPGLLLDKRLAHRQRPVLRTQTLVSLAHTPQIGLGVEVGQIGEGACWPEVLAHVTDGALHATLLVASGHGHRAWLEVVVACKRQQLWREADGIALALQHRTLEIVIE